MTFHGGEPLLRGFDYYKKIIPAIRRKLSLNTNIIFQTNGTLLNERFFELFKTHNCSVGISIDGDSFEDNKNRFKNKIQFYSVLKNIKEIKKYGVYFSLFFTIDKFDLDKINRIYNFVYDIKPNSFAINPIKGYKEGLNSLELLKLYKMNHDFMLESKINEFTTYNLDLVKLGEIPSMCTLNGMCSNFVNMDSIGNLYNTCVFKNKNLFIGNINDIDILEKLEVKTKLKIDINSSIYFKSGKNDKFKYLFGDGCKMFRKNINLDNYLKGILLYLDN